MGMHILVRSITIDTMLWTAPASEIARRAAPVVTVVGVWGLTMAIGRFEVTSALLALAIAAIPLAIVSSTMTTPTAQRWARARGAAVEGPDLDVLAHQLWRTRVARTLGVAGAMGAEVMLMSRYNADPTGFRWYVDVWNRDVRGIWMIGLGYVAGSIWAELTKPSPGAETPRLAVLSRRRLPDFLDRGVEIALLVGLATVPIGWAALMLGRSDTNGDPVLPAVLSLVVAALALLGARGIAGRSEPTATPADLVVEELSRTASVNALTGCAAAMLLSAGAELIGAVAPGWWGLAGAVLGFLALGVWAGSGTDLVFRTRRLDRLRADAT